MEWTQRLVERPPRVLCVCPNAETCTYYTTSRWYISSSGIAASSWMMAVRKKYTHFVWEDSNFFVSMPHSLLFVRVILTRRYGPNQLLLLLCRYSDKHCEYEKSNCVLYVCIVFASRANLRINFGLVLEAPLFINSIFKWTLGGLQLLGT